MKVPEVIASMTLEDLKQFLTQRQVAFVEKEIQHGTQLVCTGGEIFSFYPKNGKVVVGGKPSAIAQAFKQWSDSGFTVPSSTGAVDDEAASGPSKSLFIVYGHDTDAREQLELLVHRMNLEPIVLASLPAAGDTIIEKLEQYLGEHSNIGFACVLLTPDDEGHAKGRPEEKRYRARQNVILELGMVLARLGRKRVAILHKGSVELPSDIGGLLYIPFEERVDEVAGQLFKELASAGYQARYPT